MLKTILAALGGTLTALVAIKELAPTLYASVSACLARFIALLWSFITSLVPTPAWLLVILVLGLGAAFYIGHRVGRIDKAKGIGALDIEEAPKAQLRDLSLNELRIVQVLLTLDGRRITSDQLSRSLRIGNLETGAALSKLEELDLVDCFSYWSVGAESTYGFSNEGRALALAESQQLPELIKKKAI